MKVWKSVFVAATGSLLLGACTVTVSDDPDAFDDDDDLNIGNPSPFDGGDLGSDPTTEEETDTEVTEDTDTAPSSETDAGEVPVEEDAGEVPTDASDLPDASTDTEEPAVDSGSDDTSTDTTDTGDLPDAAPECTAPEAAPPSCEACLLDECAAEYNACACDADCSVQLSTLRSCYAELNTAEEPSLDPEGDWELCLGQAGGDNPSDLLYEVLACASEPYSPDPESAEEDPYARAEGDSQCTFACFATYSFDF